MHGHGPIVGARAFHHGAESPATEFSAIRSAICWVPAGSGLLGTALDVEHQPDAACGLT
jgi:hypothetical protein